MSFFQNIFTNVRKFYSEINAATLTGAIDVVVVEQEDGTLKSSPFHVRFGKLGVLQAKEKIVDIEINGDPIEIQMKLDDTGAAFFVEPVEDGEEEIIDSLATSPIPEQANIGWDYSNSVQSEKFATSGVQTEGAEIVKVKSLKKKRRKKTQHSRNASKTSLKEIIANEFYKIDDNNDADHEDETGDVDKEQINLPMNLKSSPVRKLARANSINVEVNASQIESSSRFLRRAFSTSSQGDHDQIENGLLGSRVPKPSSEAEALVMDALLTEQNEDSFCVENVETSNQYFSDSELDFNQSFVSEQDSSILSDSEVDNIRRDEEENIWRWGELPNSTHILANNNKAVYQKNDCNKPAKEPERKRSWFGGWGGGAKTNAIKEEPAGVYLDDILNDPEKLPMYIKTTDELESKDTELRNEIDLSELAIFDDPKEDGTKEGGNYPSLSSSDVQYDSDCGQDMLSPILSKHFPDLAVSLCGGLKTKDITLEVFEKNILTYEELVDKIRKQKSLITDPNLVVRLNDKYLTWTAAAPIVLSVILFKQPLPDDVVQEIVKDGLDVNVNLTAEQVKENREKERRSWFRWLSPYREEVSKETEKLEIACQTEEVSNEIKQKPEDDQGSSSSEPETEEVVKPKYYKKTLRLSSQKLSEMNLRPGSNEVEFSVTTAFQGTTRCKCHIYLWHHTDRVVISDIDGTITKSDVLGHILPVIGNDWAQSGVAQLFSKIRKNGYQIMYLSARAIGQASITKDYLQSVRQGDVCLPDGPLFLNPDSLYHAFRREVIDRNPEEFKISCLKDIQAVFNETNPFFAGYGNRPNDAFAYRAVGIPVSRIFTINPEGELKHELTATFQTSYTEQDQIVDQVFPPVGTVWHPQFRVQEYSQFSYWRDPLPPIQYEALQE